MQHEAKMALTAAEESRRADRHLSQRQASLRLLDVLAEYTTPASRLDDPSRWFGGNMTSGQHDALDRRVAALGRLDASTAITLNADERDRWHQLYRLAMRVQRKDAGDDVNLSRDVGDVISYAEYVRQTLVAVIDDMPIPMHAPAPDPNRADQRVWGWKPPGSSLEPDLTDWIRSRSRPSLLVRATQAHET